MIKSIVNKWIFRATAAVPVAAFVALTSGEFVTLWGCTGGASGGC